MATPVQARTSVQPFGGVPGTAEGPVSAISWGAVIAGAFAAAACSLALLALGTGIGLSAASPWSYRPESTSRIGVGAVIWLIVVQILASGLGGYLAGRLRTKWVSLHTHEVYFRDTAHGFLVWCVALVLTAAYLASAAASVASSASTGLAATPTDAQIGPNAYFVDLLFRSDRPASERVDVPTRNEAGFILLKGIRDGGMSTSDQAYLARLVSARTGLNQTEAEGRVTNVFNQYRQAADDVRKATAHSLYWTFLALLIGAFCASYAATIGGRQRDHVAAATI